MPKTDIPGILLVGYALNPKKLRKSSNPEEINNSLKISKQWNGGGLADILDNNWMNSESKNVLEFVQWDPNLDIANQPNFHILIHKLTEDIDAHYPSSTFTQAQSELSTDNNFTPNKIIALENLMKARPKLAVIDSIEAVWKVLSRARTCFTLDTIIKSSKCSFRQPNYTLIPANNQSDECDIDILSQIIQHNIRFPIICKPVQACGTTISHHMVVIVSPKDIHLLHKYRPCIVQQYYNHQGNFFKVYVIGQEVMIFRRKSLPDLDTADASLRSVEFDSRNSYPTIEDFSISNRKVSSISTCPAVNVKSCTTDSWKVSSLPSDPISVVEFSENKGAEEKSITSISNYGN